ncbi:MAG: hypothetical protein H0V87_00585 [Chloroflexi bacterium]|nr:hypothetical protein [Chloroflexota bacterium]
MKRTASAITLALSLLVVVAAPADAAPADRSCPASPSGFTVFWIDPVPNDGLADPGENAWWDMTVAGILEEGMTPEQAAAAFGFGSVEALYEFVQEALRGLDKNDDLAFCAKPFPAHQNGKLAFFFNAVDNNARVP